MISLLSTGDQDVLRDATDSPTVFWHRVRTSPKRVGAVALVTALLVLTTLLMLFGAELGLEFLTPERVAIVFAPLLLFWLGFSGYVIFKLLPDRNDRIVMALRHVVREQIDPLAERYEALSDDELRALRKQFEQRLAEGAALDDIRPEAFAAVREASRRARAHRHFECQLIGGKVLEGGNVAEMRTGEGKTIVCYAANYMKILQGRKVHMVTVNDYLVRRDAEFCRPIFDLLGCSVGFILQTMESYGEGARERQKNYACDITYGTNSEFGFDYLRDNMKHNPADLVQGAQDFAVVDEVDSILIDEARTPLIISGPAHDDIRVYQAADNVARMLLRKQEQANRETAARIPELEAGEIPADVAGEPRLKAYWTGGIAKFKSDPMWLNNDEADIIGHKQYFVVELDRKSAHMTEQGAKVAQQELGIGTFYDGKNMNWPHHIDQSLRAHLCYVRDKDYVVQEEQVVIVDEFTGRLMTGRQWSDGLHQAVEAKERIPIKQQTQTFASITLQNLFKMYKQISGMTGTAMTEAEEFNKIYKLDVVAIPTNKPVRRMDYNDKLYKTYAKKYERAVEEIHAYSHDGYPSDPWSLYDELRAARRILRSRLRETPGEAEMSGQLSAIDEALSQFNDGKGDPAGLSGAYLKVAGSHVGGRPVLVGTASVEASEKLSQQLTRTFGIEHEVLNARNHAREAEIVAKAGQQHEQMRGSKKHIVGNVTIATNMAGRGTDIVLGPGVANIGGLHVVGTERHESRRIDNQLRGRCGRQGDPGSSRFFLSFEDELLKLFMGEWVLKVLDRIADEDTPIEDRLLTRSIEKAQRKVEERNFSIRKNLLEYDEVPDQQRKKFYEMRRRVLMGRDLPGFIWEFIDETVNDAIDRFFDKNYSATIASEWCTQHLGVSLEPEKLDLTDFRYLSDQISELGETEVRAHVQRTIGEYIDPDAVPEDWDTRGLVNWAATYGLTLTQRQVTETPAEDLQDMVIEAALKKIAATDISALKQLTDKSYARQKLAAWAHDKFGVQIPLEDLVKATREEAEQIIRDRMREQYRRREIDYPVAAAVQYALQRAGTNANAFYEQMARWANLKFQGGWNLERLAGKRPIDIYNELRSENEQWLTNGRIDGEVEQILSDGKSPVQVVEWARQRFGRVVEMNPIDPEGDLREQLKRCSYEMLRYELTRLEQAVLLQAFDAAWKDHMYGMDLLRHGIGLRGYAEQDPKIAFKREGSRMFSETMASIRERVTDVIFKVGQVDDGEGKEGSGGGVPSTGAAGGPAPRPVMTAPTEPATGVPPAGLTTSHADGTGAAYASARPAASGGQGGGAGVPNIQPSPQAGTFRRETPKVGRNDPCPCGSGKKYKQCHGKG